MLVKMVFLKKNKYQFLASASFFTICVQEIGHEIDLCGGLEKYAKGWGGGNLDQKLLIRRD